MARTKAAARRGQDGHDCRENQKRKREEVEGLKKDKETFQDQNRPLKKAKSTITTLQKTSHQTSSDVLDQSPNAIPSSTPVTSTPSTSSIQPQIPAPHDLSRTHQTTHMSVISSSQIQKKATHVLSILGTFSFSDPLPHVVLLSAKASVACKLISIAEIVKRELAKNGAKWFQYNVIGELRTTVPSNDTELRKNEEEKEGDVEMREEDQEEAFEIMKTPFERALEAEERPKIRAIPTLTLYLSRVRIERLKTMYGEQTNTLT